MRVLLILALALSGCKKDAAETESKRLDINPDGEDEYKTASGSGDGSGNSTVGNFTVHANGRVASLIISSTVNTELDRGEADLKAIASEIYDYVNDEFDFIVLLSNNREIPATISYAGVYHPVRNDTSGIGQTTFDLTSQYGSAGKLQGVIHLPVNTYILEGPILHEFIHRYANFTISSAVSAHWGYSNACGQLGGWCNLTDNGDGTYSGTANRIGGSTASFGLNANGANSVVYGNIELYLMGLIDSSDLNDVVVANGASFTDFFYTKFSASSFTTTTSGDFVSTYGTRSSGEQTSYRSIVVILSVDDVGADVFTTVDEHAEKFTQASDPGFDSSWYVYNFWQATGGRATMRFDGLNDTLK